MGGEALRRAAGHGGPPQVATVHEHDEVAMDVGEAEQPCLGGGRSDLGGGGRCGKQADEGDAGAAHGDLRDRDANRRGIIIAWRVAACSGWDILVVMKLRWIQAAALAACAAAGCSGSNSPDPVPAGAYAYSGFDSTGRVVVTGSMTLDVTNPASVTGTWHLQPTGSSQNLGPQVGDGQL